MKWTPTEYRSGSWSIKYSPEMKEWYAYRDTSSMSGAMMLGPFKTVELAFDEVEGKDQ